MSRNFFSMTGLCVALFGFALGGSDAEARHCGRQRPRCCQQSGNFGYRPLGTYAPNYNDGSVYQQTNNWNGQQTSCCTPQPSGPPMQSNFATPMPATTTAPPAPPAEAPVAAEAPIPAAGN